MRSGYPKAISSTLAVKRVGKNVHLLCEWFANYAEKSNRGTKLVFIGGGDESLVPSNDHFIDFGFVSEARKQHLISHSKGIINLSENESFSHCHNGGLAAWSTRGSIRLMRRDQESCEKIQRRFIRRK